MKLIIIRGLPGSGKTTLANKLMVEEDAMHFEADHFHGAEFNRGLVEASHAYCFGNAIYNLKQGTNVVVSNTFTTLWEIEKYVDAASILGAEIEIIHIRSSKYKSVHDVPEKTMQAMRKRMIPNNKIALKYPQLIYKEYQND